MVASICRHANAPWEQLLSDSLPVEQMSLLSNHIEHCSQCRHQFESLCASSAMWEDSAVVLKELPSEIPGFSTQFQKESPAIRPQAGARIILAGLAPALDPESLGELDEFSIREVIGYGGMGTVFKAWDRKLCRIVAIKLLHPHLAANGAARHRFAREAQSAAGIAHPNVVPIHNVASDRDHPYLVMAYVPGGSLQDKIDRDGPFTLLESLRITSQIAEGLIAAHQQGIVHRDIKPANILLEASWQRALITDFGLARALDDASLTASGMLAGTPQYMSPEQTLGDAIDHRSDLFSLGSVFYTMLTGRVPFRAESAVGVLRAVQEAEPISLTQVDESLPAWVQKLLESFHAKQPCHRIESAEQAATLLKDCMQYVQSPNQHSLPSIVVATPRVPRWRVATYVAVALVSVSLLVFWDPYQHEPTTPLATQVEPCNRPDGLSFQACRRVGR